LVDALTRAGGATSQADILLAGGAADPGQVHLVRDGVGTVVDLRPLTIRPQVIDPLVWLYVPGAQGSRLRENIGFWGSVAGTLFTAVSLVILIAR
jgi:hypothetical protein